MDANIKNTGLVGELVVVILFAHLRKIAARLLAEDEKNIMLENSKGERSIIPKDSILKIRRPYVSRQPGYYTNLHGNPRYKGFNTSVDCEDPDENLAEVKISK
jgi:hypothetical protein